MMDPAEASFMAALLGAVGALWRHIAKNIRDLQIRSDACEKDRVEIHTRLDQHGKELSVFKACPAEPCPARDGLKRSEAFNLKHPA